MINILKLFIVLYFSILLISIVAASFLFSNITFTESIILHKNLFWIYTPIAFIAAIVIKYLLNKI